MGPIRLDARKVESYGTPIVSERDASRIYYNITEYYDGDDYVVNFTPKPNVKILYFMNLFMYIAFFSGALVNLSRRDWGDFFISFSCFLGVYAFGFLMSTWKKDALPIELR